MTISDIVRFLRDHRWAVLSTVAADGAPQSALLGFVVTDRLEIFFDTSELSRKVANLRIAPRVALVIGGWDDGDERTVQLEGIADFPTGEELTALKEKYRTTFPEGVDREARSDLVYVRVKPKWLRFSDFNVFPPEKVEIDL